jgi:hypothetical protein
VKKENLDFKFLEMSNKKSKVERKIEEKKVKKDQKIFSKFCPHFFKLILNFGKIK